MAYWAVDVSENKPDRITIPELTSSDLKVAVATYRSSKDSDSETKDRSARVLNYEASPLRSTTGYNLRVLYRVVDERFTVNFQLRYVKNDACKTEKETFRKELLFFGCVMPKVKQFLPYHQSKVPVPDCFLARSHDDEALRQSAKSSPCCVVKGSTDLIIIEDLINEGYEPCQPPYDMVHLELAIKSLAHLHGLSVYLNRRGNNHNLSIPQCFPSLVPETFFSKRYNPVLYSQFQMATHIFSAVGPMLNQEMLVPGKDVVPVVRLLMSGLWEVVEDVMKASATHINALCVVDCDAANFLFSYDDRRVPIACKISKFRNAKFTRPITDFVSLIYNCSMGGFSSDQYQHLCDVYHDDFVNTFKKCHIKFHSTLPLPAGLLSMQELRQTFAECRLLGAAQRAVLTSFGCLLNFDDPDAEDHLVHVDTDMPMHHLVWHKLLEDKINLPSNLADLRNVAVKTLQNNPYYRSSMFESLSDLLTCLSARIYCELPEPHKRCPHPNP
ncbi:Hypothetical predicted protein [Cloeon dipterum]|uniref:CHK kinase-like domain-containing protein n=1 Tax=Cloeon dipterum TaxID=197152 RepID=A0A8S1DHL1_9INSE|nr:Hypothetical predicted protein [Cloeon dipterum]